MTQPMRFLCYLGFCTVANCVITFGFFNHGWDAFAAVMSVQVAILAWAVR